MCLSTSTVLVQSGQTGINFCKFGMIASKLWVVEFP